MKGFFKYRAAIFLTYLELFEGPYKSFSQKFGIVITAGWDGTFGFRNGSKSFFYGSDRNLCLSFVWKAITDPMKSTLWLNGTTIS